MSILVAYFIAVGYRENIQENGLFVCFLAFFLQISWLMTAMSIYMQQCPGTGACGWARRTWWLCHWSAGWGIYWLFVVTRLWVWPFLRSSLVTCGMELPRYTTWVCAGTESSTQWLSHSHCCRCCCCCSLGFAVLCAYSSRILQVYMYCIFACNCLGAVTCVFLFLLYLHASRHHMLVTPLKTPDVEAITWPTNWSVPICAPHQAGATNWGTSLLDLLTWYSPTGSSCTWPMRWRDWEMQRCQ